MKERNEKMESLTEQIRDGVKLRLTIKVWEKLSEHIRTVGVEFPLCIEHRGTRTVIISRSK